MTLQDAVKVSKVERTLDNGKDMNVPHGAQLQYAPNKFLFAYITCVNERGRYVLEELINIPSHHLTFNPYNLSEISAYPKTVQKFLNDEGWEPF